MRKLLLILLLFLIVTSGCVTSSGTVGKDNTEPIIVSDALDRQITFNKAPQRIVVTGKASIMILDALYLFPEAKDRVVAFEDVAQGDTNFIGMLDPEYRQKAFLVRDAGVEQFVSAEPDVVIMKSSQEEKFGAPLEAINIPVVYLDLETPEQYERDLVVIGKLFSNEERAQELINYYKNTADDIQNTLSKVGTRPKTLMLYYDDKDGAVAFNVPPLSWIQTRLVEMAGGDVVWEDANPGKGWTMITVEQIAVWDPDVILLITYNNDPKDVIKVLKDDPLWKTLRAVQSEKLLAFPGDLYSWDQPDTRWILGLQWLAEKLYPEELNKTDIVANAQEFYRFAYELDKDFFEANILPNFTGDVP